MKPVTTIRAAAGSPGRLPVRATRAAPARAVPPSRRDEARALFRNGILHAAERVFAEQGFHGARIQDIAREARTAVGTVYNHFEQKEDILRSLMEERIDAFLATLKPTAGEPADFESRLRLRLGRLFEYVDSHRSFFQVAMDCGILLGSATDANRELMGASGKRMERFRTAFRALVEEGIASGALEAREPKHLAAFLGGTIRSFTYGAILDKETSLGDMAEIVVELFLHGAAAKGRRGARK